MGQDIDADKELTNKKSHPSRRERIENLLLTNFAPTHLEILDESAAHAGHSGARAEGETHFRVRISAPSLAALSRVDRQRKIMAVLADEFADGLHALALEVN